MRLILSLSLALAVANVANVEAAEVYRSVAPDGTVVYSDRPTGPDAVPIGMSAPRPATAALQTAAALPRTASLAAPSAASNTAAARQSAREQAAQRAQNCTLARERAESYTGARRLYRELENGEREYLSDAEIDAARARAAADVESWCS